jgi:hypothetical protein
MRRPLRSAASHIAVRAVLVAAALVLLSRANEGLIRVRETYSQTFRFEMGPWLYWVVPAALSGVAFALAAAPSWTLQFRWVVCLSVGLIPVLLLAQTFYVFGVAAPNKINSSWLTRFYWFAQAEPQFRPGCDGWSGRRFGFVGTPSSSKDSGPVDTSDQAALT